MRLHHLFRDCSFAYDVKGVGPPVIFIQGVGVCGSASVPQVDGLCDRYRCIWFDNRGIGDSQPFGQLLSIERMAEDVLELLDTQGVESAHVVGHSMGGMIAQHVALHSPHRVRSLSLLCTFHDGKEAYQSPLRMMWAGFRISFGAKSTRRRAFLEAVMPPRMLEMEDNDALAERLAPIFGHDLADLPAIVPAQYVALAACDTTKRLPELAGIPTLVVSAAYDEIATPKTGETLAAGIPGARFIEIAESSHGLPIQHPGLINGLLAEHFTNAEKARRKH